MWHTFVQPQPACSVMTVELCRPRHPPRTVHTEVLLHVIHHLPQPYQPSSMQNIKYRFECLFETLLLEPQAVIWRLPVAASDPSCVPGSIACDHIQTLCLCSPLAVLVPLMLLRLKKAKLWHFCRSTYSSLFIFVCLMACSFSNTVHSGSCTLSTNTVIFAWAKIHLSNLWYSDVSVLQNVISYFEDIQLFPAETSSVSRRTKFSSPFNFNREIIARKFVSF